VKELSQASGLTEDLVRYWFSTKTTPLPPPPQAQAEAAAPDRTGHVSPGTAAATETHEKPERTGASESPPLKAPGESEEPKADGGTKEVEEEEEKEEESSEPTPSKGMAASLG
jgi:hypothetical protein